MRTKVKGVTHSNDDGTSRGDIIRTMTVNDSICLERDPYNKFDSSAVKVCLVRNGENLPIGFLDRGLAAQISPRMRRRESFPVKIVSCGFYCERPYCEIEIDGI
jgi:hypothetical protein